MSDRTLGWLARPGKGRRIAFAMIAALVVVQVQAFLQIWLLSDPVVRMTGTRWLAETAAAAAQNGFALAPSARADALGARKVAMPVQFSWSEDRPWPALARSDDPMVARLDATLRQIIGSEIRKIEIVMAGVTVLAPFETFRVEVSPPEVTRRLGAAAIGLDEPDVLIPASVRVAIQGQDGSWIAVMPEAIGDRGFGLPLPVMPLLAGGMIILIGSTWIARRIVAPLDRLVVAAERIGTTRSFVAIPEQGLGEFVAVARAFEDMQRRLLRFVDDRTQMLAAISHDLRSALTRMRIAAEEVSPPVVHAAVTAEIDEMQAMLDSTLAFAGGEARTAPSQLTDIAAMLISLADEAEDAGRDCTYAGPNHAETAGHPVSLKRAFRNLIDNAIKHGGVARVALAADTAGLHLTIDDDGPGIAPDRVEEAFAPFRRLDAARSGDKPGVGLGLTIARDVIHSHGGTITLANRKEGGLRCAVTLPRR